MFEDLFDLSKFRDNKQAIGFYIVHTAIMLGFCAFFGAILGLSGLIASQEDALFNGAQFIGMIVATIYCIVLSLKILIKKKITAPRYKFLAIIGGLILGPLAGVLAMFIPAYLTTKNKLTD